MSILQAIILGLVQGLTEFLPVSSSGHLVLTQTIMNLDTGSPEFLFVDTMLHVGTLVAIIYVLRKEIMGIFRNPTGKLLRMLVVATLPTVVIALVFKDVFMSSFEGDFLGISFLITGGILILAEFLAKRGPKRKFAQANYLDAAIMGVMQGIAIVPGISRSGSTLSGGLARGINRYSAAKFAFLMAIPAILGSLVLQVKDLFSIHTAISIPWVPVLIGTVAAAISGMWAATWMLKLIRKHRLYGFSIYVIILGVLVLMDQLVFHAFFNTPFV